MADPVLSYIDEARTRVDDALSRLVTQTDPGRLYDPVRHVLEAPGKRFRPLLTLAAAEMYDGNPDAALHAALSMEIFHTFTLVHDDIMDRSPERRGRPTVHVLWDEPTAILCGDYLMGLAVEELLHMPVQRLPEVMRRFTHAVRVLCEGQIRDMEFEERDDVSLQEYLSMIEQKTSALLQTSLVMGGLSGTASRQDLDVLDATGYHLGRAFQIQDDLLDLTADDARWGKPIGGDLVSGKNAFLILKALELTSGSDRDWFLRVLKGGLDPAEVVEARNRMDSAGVLEAARKAVIFHTDTAQEHIQSLPTGRGRDVLQSLAFRMQRRVH